MEKNKKILTSLNLFSDLDSEVIDKLARQIIIKRYCEGNILFFDEEKVKSLYIILSGKVKISKFTNDGREKIIHILAEGDIINEISLDKRPSSVTAKVMEESKIISIKVNSLLRIMEDSFELTLRILNSSNLKLRQTYRQVRNLGLKMTGERIASRLWKLARDYRGRKERGIEIDLNLTQRELALMVGSSRETVSRSLSELDKHEIISCKSGNIIVKDVERLRKWAKKNN